jgi:hypothetical protein
MLKRAAFGFSPGPVRINPIPITNTTSTARIAWVTMHETTVKRASLGLIRALHYFLI